MLIHQQRLGLRYCKHKIFMKNSVLVQFGTGTGQSPIFGILGIMGQGKFGVGQFDKN